MEKTYKTIIIGAGPGGLIAGRNLDDFLILDKKSVIGEPVQCGEGISKKALSMHQIEPDEVVSTSILSKNINELFKFFSAREGSSDYSW